MGEYVDESLVVLKNVLNWSLTDLVYVTEKENIEYAEISSQIQVYSRIKNIILKILQTYKKMFLNFRISHFLHISFSFSKKDAIKEHNELDQAIYDHFNNTFWKTVESYGSNFTSDLEKLRGFNRKLADYCKGSFGNITSTEGDTVCKRMKWGDNEYVPYLKGKYQVMSNTELNSGLQYLKNSLELYFKTTAKEIQRYLDS